MMCFVKGIFEALPKELSWQGSKYKLHTDKTDDGKVILTYEDESLKEDSFLLSTFGEDVDEAAISMLKHLERL